MDLLPYYSKAEEYESDHYICVIGYDEASDNVIISDCTYIPAYFGLKVISIGELFTGTITESGSIAYYNYN